MVWGLLGIAWLLIAVNLAVAFVNFRTNRRLRGLVDRQLTWLEKRRLDETATRGHHGSD